MPTNGQGEFSPQALAHKAAYHGAVRRARELAEQHRAELRAARERRQSDREYLREQREDRRELARDLRQDVDESREAYRRASEAYRLNPLADLYRRWGGRIDSGTLYDARTWRTTGRLVPVSERTRYQGGVRREVVDWTDVLDRETQSLGIDARDLPRAFEGVRRQRSQLRELAADVDQRRQTLQNYRREVLAA